MLSIFLKCAESARERETNKTGSVSSVHCAIDNHTSETHALTGSNEFVEQFNTFNSTFIRFACGKPIAIHLAAEKNSIKIDKWKFSRYKKTHVNRKKEACNAKIV